MRREQKSDDADQARHNAKTKMIFIWGIVILIIGGSGFGVFKYFSTLSPEDVSYDVTKSCINHAGGYHIHPSLRIVINDEEQDIAVNVGVSPGCMRPLHTHDKTGKLHVEFPKPRDFVLADFFNVWDRVFSSEQIFKNIVDDTHSIKITVNGKESDKYENLILKDGDDIEIIYEEKAEELP